MLTSEINPELRERFLPDFLQAISEGMHTMAQPLTVLRATLEIAAGNACCVSQFQRAVDTSLVEITRVTEAMRFVQELMRIARDVTPGVPVDLRSILETVQDDLQCVLDSAGVITHVSWPDEAVTVRVSPQRLRQCLLYLLQHALKSCLSRDTILVKIGFSKASERLMLTLDCGNSYCDETKPHHDLAWGQMMPCLVLAEALVNADGGQLEWGSQPFFARMTLPRAHEDELLPPCVSPNYRNDEIGGSDRGRL